MDQPPDRRAHSSNWLAEGNFTPTQVTTMAYHTDTVTPGSDMSARPLFPVLQPSSRALQMRYFRIRQCHRPLVHLDTACGVRFVSNPPTCHVWCGDLGQAR